MSEPVVGIVGMAALRRDLARMATDESGPLYAALKQAGTEAIQPIIEAARSAIPASDRASAEGRGKLAASVRGSGTRTGATVRMGSAAVPYAGWMEFGGTRRSPHRSFREIVHTGRYLYPAARGLEGRAAESYSYALGRIFASAGVWTNTTSDPGAIHD